MNNYNIKIHTFTYQRRTGLLGIQVASRVAELLTIRILQN